MAAYDDEDDTVTAPDASSETAPNGITRMVLNNAGQVTEAMLYSAYGTMSYMGSTPAGTENTKEKFTGKELDKDGAYGSITAGIGAYCLGVRMYDPEIAMFMACDPKSQYWSPYSYCGDNPLRLVDPSGKNSKDPQDSTQDSTQLDSLANGKKVTVSEDEEKELRKQAREYAYLGGELTEDQIFELLRNRKLKEKAGKAKEGEGKAGGSGVSGASVATNVALWASWAEAGGSFGNMAWNSGWSTASQSPSTFRLQMSLAKNLPTAGQSLGRIALPVSLAATTIETGIHLRAGEYRNAGIEAATGYGSTGAAMLAGFALFASGSGPWAVVTLPIALGATIYYGGQQIVPKR